MTFDEQVDGLKRNIRASRMRAKKDRIQRAQWSSFFLSLKVLAVGISASVIGDLVL
jgi:hypothetical protein